jgi:hypothetical protein
MKNVHQRASEERQPDEKADHMRPVLGEQQRTGSDQKSNKHQSGLGLRGHALSRLFLMNEVVLRRHRNAPSGLGGETGPASIEPV